MKTEDNKEDG